MDDKELEVILKEFEILRSEVNSRTTLAYGLITLQLAALGTGISFIGKFPDVLLGLAAVSCFLWLYWVDHAGQVYKIAAYAARVLAPRLSALTDERVLGWERYLRELEDPKKSTAALYGLASQGRRAFIQRATAADWYSALLFGLTAPGLVVAYISTVLHVDHRLAMHVLVEATLVGVLWLLALWRFVSFKRTVQSIGRAILAPDPGQNLPGNVSKSS
jgi:hypothetical protein